MKANRTPKNCLTRRLLRRRPMLSGALGGALMLALASCTAPVEAPPPASPAPLPARVAPAPVTAVLDWKDAPLTPGFWSWAMTSGGSTASYGTRGNAPVFQFHCPRGSASVALFVPAAQGGAPDRLLALLTSTASRQMSAQAMAEGYSVSLGAGDRMLDAVAFSRGRFAVEVMGLARLVLPADPAISRVVEDCRAAH